MSKTAMKLALEALEVATTPFARDRQEVLRAQAALREALAEQQAQQEPVGSLSVRYHRGCKSMTNTDFDYNGDLPEGDYELYTSPPAQRTWVGLTDEEVNKLVDDEDWYNDPHEFSRIVEAKVRGKNDAS